MAVDEPSKRRWREYACRVERAFALDMPLPPEVDIRIAVHMLATYVKCLTIDVAESNETDRWWRGPPGPMPDLPRFRCLPCPRCGSWVNPHDCHEDCTCEHRPDGTIAVADGCPYHQKERET